MRALIVDDSKAIRVIIGKVLKELGFELYEAANGVEGLNLIKTLGPVELVTIDWNMPEMNGFDLIKEIRADSTYDRSRLLMVTTEAELSQVMKAIGAGANEYLMKPFTKDALLSKLSILGLMSE